MPRSRRLPLAWDPLRRAFSLVELVAVVLIVATIAAVAVPRVIDIAVSAQAPGLVRTLQVIREAIDLYAADHGGKLPGRQATSASFKSEVVPYLRMAFTVSPVGAKNDRVQVVASPNALTPTAVPAHGWKYSNKTGEFICNCGQPTPWDPSVMYSDL